MHLGKTDFATAHAVAVTTHFGLIAGSTVMTMNGERPVESLVPGDRIITRDSGMAVLRDITCDVSQLDCVCIKAGSLGHFRPDRDMIVSAEALIFVRDWRAEALFNSKTALVPASRLVDGEFVAKIGQRHTAIYALSFDAPHILYVDGIEMASGPM